MRWRKVFCRGELTRVEYGLGNSFMGVIADRDICDRYWWVFLAMAVLAMLGSGEN